ATRLVSAESSIVVKMNRLSCRSRNIAATRPARGGGTSPPASVTVRVSATGLLDGLGQGPRHAPVDAQLGELGVVDEHGRGREARQVARGLLGRGRDPRPERALAPHVGAVL